MATTTINVTSQLLYSATFFDTTTQNNGGATTANQVLFGSTQQSNGFTLTNNSIEILNDGVYFSSLSSSGKLIVSFLLSK
jgi:hypothetical protein